MFENSSDLNALRKGSEWKDGKKSTNSNNNYVFIRLINYKVTFLLYLFRSELFKFIISVIFFINESLYIIFSYKLKNLLIFTAISKNLTAWESAFIDFLR